MIGIIPTPHLRQVCDSQSGLIAIHQWFAKIDTDKPNPMHEALYAYVREPGNPSQGEWRNVTCVRPQNV